MLRAFRNRKAIELSGGQQNQLEVAGRRCSIRSFSSSTSPRSPVAQPGAGSFTTLGPHARPGRDHPDGRAERQGGARHVDYGLVLELGQTSMHDAAAKLLADTRVGQLFRGGHVDMAPAAHAGVTPGAAAPRAWTEAVPLGCPCRCHHRNGGTYRVAVARFACLLRRGDALSSIAALPSARRCGADRRCRLPLVRRCTSRPFRPVRRRPGADQRAAAAQDSAKTWGVGLGHAGAGQKADDAAVAAPRGTGTAPMAGGDQPAAGQHRASPGNGDDASPSQQPAGAARAGPCSAPAVRSLPTSRRVRPRLPDCGERITSVLVMPTALRACTASSATCA